MFFKKRPKIKTENSDRKEESIEEIVQRYERLNSLQSGKGFDILDVNGNGWIDTVEFEDSHKMKF